MAEPPPNGSESGVDGWSVAPCAVNEPERLQAVAACGLVGLPPAKDFDAAVRRAAEICEAPIALVTLIAAERVWIAAGVGTDLREVPRKVALCSHTILERGPLIIADTRRDARFAGNPLVTGAPGVRFYAGAPLVTRDGLALGTLCVMDVEPRQLSAAQRAELSTLAREVALGLELRRASSELTAAEDARHGQQAMRDAIVAAALDCIVTIDHEGRVTEFNPAAEHTFGYTRAEAVGQDVSELIIPPSLRRRHREGLRRVLSTGETRIMNHRVELEGMRRDGSRFPVELTVTQLAADPPLFCGHIRDISERKRAEGDQLRLAAIVDSTQDAVVGLDSEGLIIHWNRAAEQLYGYQRHEIIGSSMEKVMPAERIAELRQLLGRVLTGERCERLETQRITKDGRLLDVAVTLSPIVDARGQVVGVSSIGRDISDRKRFEATLRHQAEHDSLTELVNRRVFERRLEHLAAVPADGGPLGSLVFLDLDHFKLVNDSLGHRAGDQVIRHVAEVLRRSVRASDVAARLGGDEFAILLPGCAAVEAVRVADELIERIAATPSSPGVGASAGVAELWSGTSAEDVMVAADMALYEAKSLGGRRAALYTGREPQALRTVSRVRAAIAHDRFVLHAQPIIELETDTVVQHELLVRMLDEHGRLIPPNEFIPVAEHFALIQDIDRWVLARAVELARAGRHVAVNLSARSLTDSALRTLVHEQIQAGLDARHLSFELTETAALSDIEAARGFAGPLAELGCGFALDDFGTGFGALVHLKQLPINTIKLDMDFVRNAARSKPDRDMIQAMVGVAGVLGHRTIAEGVEDATTLELLRELGVDQAQGYHIGRPGPIGP